MIFHDRYKSEVGKKDEAEEECIRVRRDFLSKLSVGNKKGEGFIFF